MENSNTKLNEYENSKATLKSYIKEAEENKILYLRKYDKLSTSLQNAIEEKDLFSKMKKPARIVFVICLILGLVGSSTSLWLVSYQDFYLTTVIIPIVSAIAIFFLSIAFLAFFFCGYRFNKSYTEEVNSKPKYNLIQRIRASFLVKYQQKINYYTYAITSYQNQLKNIDKEIAKINSPKQ